MQSYLSLQLLTDRINRCSHTFPLNSRTSSATFLYKSFSCSLRNVTLSKKVLRCRRTIRRCLPLIQPLVSTQCNEYIANIGGIIYVKWSIGRFLPNGYIECIRIFTLRPCWKVDYRLTGKRQFKDGTGIRRDSNKEKYMLITLTVNIFSSEISSPMHNTKSTSPEVRALASCNIFLTMCPLCPFRGTTVCEYFV